MENIKLNIEAIRMNMGKSRKEMADAMQINLDRYNRLATGESRMYGDELILLHQISSVPYENIDVKRD